MNDCVNGYKLLPQHNTHFPHILSIIHSNNFLCSYMNSDGNHLLHAKITTALAIFCAMLAQSIRSVGLRKHQILKHKSSQLHHSYLQKCWNIHTVQWYLKKNVELFLFGYLTPPTLTTSVCFMENWRKRPEEAMKCLLIWLFVSILDIKDDVLFSICFEKDFLLLIMSSSNIRFPWFAATVYCIQTVSSLRSCLCKKNRLELGLELFGHYLELTDSEREKLEKKKLVAVISKGQS